MPLAPLIPAVEAAVFTLGCALIHAQRRRAERLTDVLVVITAVTLLGIAVLTTPIEELNTVAEAAATADLGASIPLQPE